MDHLSIKYTNISRPSKIYPNLDFWFENKPSGNPDLQPSRRQALPAERKKVLELSVSSSRELLHFNDFSKMHCETRFPIAQYILILVPSKSNIEDN
jgi:hypothetical protein